MRHHPIRTLTLEQICAVPFPPARSRRPVYRTTRKLAEVALEQAHALLATGGAMCR